MLDDVLERAKKMGEPKDEYRPPFSMELERQLRTLQIERESLTARFYQQEFELNRLRKELGELKSVPSLVGQIQEIINSDSAVIRIWNGNEFLVSIPEDFRGKLKVGSRVAMAQRSLGIIQQLPDSKDWEVHAFEILAKPDVSFEQIGGLEHARVELEEAVVWPLLEPERFEKLGISPPNGVLLNGSPGTGKTLLAKALANKTNAAFINLTGSELVKKYIGEGSRMVREVFALAKEKKPAIIFIDELDAIGGHRGDFDSGGDREVQRTLMQLLSEMDGFKDRKGIAILGATNRLDMIDSALLRPGRFDRIVKIPLPNTEARETILKIHSKKMNISSKIDFSKLGTDTLDFSGADLKNACMEAGFFALREKAGKVQTEHFQKAIEKIRDKHNNADAETKTPEKMFA
ncbi:MAG: AAA family ATPase [Candidatus Micrarchaeota archaeon]